jgi:hypothetical protein
MDDVVGRRRGESIIGLMSGIEDLCGRRGGHWSRFRDTTKIMFPARRCVFADRLQVAEMLLFAPVPELLVRRLLVVGEGERMCGAS